MMSVNMAYSPEGEMVDALFGDEVAARQFEKFAKDMNAEPFRGKYGKIVFKNDKNKPVFEMNIEGIDKEPIQSATTGAMREFLKRTVRADLRSAARILQKPGAGDKEVEKAKKILEKGKDKFTDKEWEELMRAFEEGKDLTVLAAKLGSWPLIAKEIEYLTSREASLRRLALKLAMEVIATKVAARGLQLNRKKKDTMRDTGGESKILRREPELKPPRDDVRKPFRTKNKPKSEKDPDIDRDPDLTAAVNFSVVAKRELAKWPARFSELVEMMV